jgi:lysyl-tRNA synthetase class II
MELPLDDLNAVVRARREKLEKIKALGINPYPHDFKRTHFAADAKNHVEEYFEKVTWGVYEDSVLC